MPRHISFKYSLLLLLLGLTLKLRAQPDSLSVPQETRIRGGLPHILDKLKNGQLVNMVYLGGSITNAADGYREQSTAWLQKQYPQAKIQSINAGIGGTGSDFGAFRVGSQVLPYKPDLVFIEFAVNDQNREPAQIKEAMEGIVRQIWQNNSRTDILFVYTLTADMAATLQAGKLPASARAMEDIAQYYNIPSVHMGLEVVALAAAGKLIFKGTPEEFPGKTVFSRDNVHPYPDTGHRLYTEALGRAFSRMQNANLPATKRRLPKPLSSANWEKAQMISVNQIARTGNWQEVGAHDANIKPLLPKLMPFVLKSTTPGAALTFKFKGTRFGLNDVMGPGTGTYEIIIDGGTPQIYRRFDKYCTYYRANYFISPVLKPGLHTVQIRVSDAQPDKKVILQDNPTDLEKNPEKYSENACYASGLLLLGELVSNLNPALHRG